MEYRKGLPERPQRMRDLPLNEKGYPVPWFVEWVDGKPDFRIMDGIKWVRAVLERRCWICGDILGRFQTFVAGPMCGINRTSGEPPSHLECAVYAARACPFLTLPKSLRRDAKLPEQGVVVNEGMLERNPGVALLWTVLEYKVFRAGGTQLIEMGDPTSVTWFAEGRIATRAQVIASVMSGLPLLEEIAKQDGAASVHKLHALAEEFAQFLPPGAEPFVMPRVE